MTVQEMPIKITSEGGKLRAELPATTLEAEDVVGLVRQIEHMVEVIMAAVESGLRDAAEENALRDIEKVAPRRAALERLADLYPPPRQWLEEPE